MRQRQGTVSLLPSALVNITGMVAPGADLQIRDINHLFPVSPSVLRVTPCGNSSGRIPIPIRLERWIRSNDSAITTRIPNSRGPFAAQSRLDPDPYSSRQLPPAAFFLLVEHRGIINRHRFRTRQMPRHPTFDAGQHFVANTNIGERTAHHHFMVAAP